MDSLSFYNSLIYRTENPDVSRIPTVVVSVRKLRNYVLDNIDLTYPVNLLYTVVVDLETLCTESKGLLKSPHNVTLSTEYRKVLSAHRDTFVERLQSQLPELEGLLDDLLNELEITLG